MAAAAGRFVLPEPSLPPLHSLHFSPFTTALNRLFAAIYGGGILALFYYHIASLLKPSSPTSFFVSLSLLISDLILAFMWSTTQSCRMNPIHRREYPENLNQLLNRDSDFPMLDVFICTADPYKEPPMSVVNTALSVMAYDYPAEKITVYVSDDGGSALTLFAFMEAAKFAGHWLPFCRKHGILERNPDAFFASNLDWNSEIENIKTMYEKMKMKVEEQVEKGEIEGEYMNGEQESLIFNKWTKSFTSKNHPTIIQVLLESYRDRDIGGDLMPNLIYVSRQKSLTSHHHFKAGALNTLLRVSAIMTNAPIILTLDCDVYSNDPKTLDRVLCYVFDPKLRANLSYIQFPQRFHGLSKNDIYACEFKRLYEFNPIGMDGLLGPCYVGTGCFFLRRAFFGGPFSMESLELLQLDPNRVVDRPISSPDVMDLAHSVAACDYENGTKWGSKVGFRYGSLSEDFHTGYHMQSQGWKSVFCNPNRPAFYGDAPISLLDAVNQNKRWIRGLLQVTFSKYSPITFGVKSMGLLMGLAYCNNAFWFTLSVPIIVYAFLPPLTLINGISIFPKVSEPWFILYTFLFIGAYGQDLLDFVLAGSRFKKWWNDQRMWKIRAISSYFFGSVEFAMKFLNISTHGFNVTSKVSDREKRKRYEQELFEFGASSTMIVPMALAAMINLGSLVSGLIRVLRGGDWEGILVQMLMAGFVVLNCLPVYEAMALRSDPGKMPLQITFLSVIVGLILFSVAI